MSRLHRKRTYLRETELASTYDVVVIGGGAHGLAIAYYLARHHGVKRVAVLERSYIGCGGSGRNTTVLRANYKTPEAIEFYKASFALYRGLAQELDYNLLYSPRGLLWLAHSEPTLRLQHERAMVNQAHEVDTVFLSARDVGELCPQLDLSVGNKRPVLGAAYHAPGGIIRHDAVVWGYAAAAQRLGVSVHQGIEVTNVRVAGGRATGVETSAGFVAAGHVVCATGGWVTHVADMVGLRLPIVTHPLQAFVTEPYKPVLTTVVASADLLVYISQSARGELLVGAEIERYPTFSTRSTYTFLSEAAARAIDLFPWMSRLRILRQWTGLCDMTPDFSPLLGQTPIEGFTLNAGWGTWGFKAAPVAGVTIAELVATGRVNALIEPFGLDRFKEGRAVSERASAGTH